MSIWSALVFAYNEILASAKLNLMQDNFNAMAEGAVGAPSILHNAITTGSAAVILNTDNTFTSTSYQARDGASVSIDTRTGNILVGVKSSFRTLSTINAYFRINRDSGAEYRAFGSGFSNASETFFVGGTALFTGLSVGAHTFIFEVRVDGGTAQNLSATIAEWMPFEMYAIEI